MTVGERTGFSPSTTLVLCQPEEEETCPRLKGNFSQICSHGFGYSLLKTKQNVRCRTCKENLLVRSMVQSMQRHKHFWMQVRMTTITSQCCNSASGYDIVVCANAELIRETGRSWIESVLLIKLCFRVQRVGFPPETAEEQIVELLFGYRSTGPPGFWQGKTRLSICRQHDSFI